MGNRAKELTNLSKESEQMQKMETRLKELVEGEIRELQGKAVTREVVTRKMLTKVEDELYQSKKKISDLQIEIAELRTKIHERKQSTWFG